MVLLFLCFTLLILGILSIDCGPDVRFLLQCADVMQFVPLVSYFYVSSSSGFTHAHCLHMCLGRYRYTSVGGCCEEQAFVGTNRSLPAMIQLLRSKL